MRFFQPSIESLLLNVPPFVSGSWGWKFVSAEVSNSAGHALRIPPVWKKRRGFTAARLA